LAAADVSRPLLPIEAVEFVQPDGGSGTICWFCAEESYQVHE